VRYPEFMRLAAMWDITLANLEGRFSDAKELADELSRRLARIGHSQAQLIPLAQMFPWWLLRGHSPNYLSTLEELSAYEPANIAWPAITAWCLAATGDLDRAADLLHRTEPAAATTADLNYQWWAVIVGFAGAVDLVGDRKWAEVLYDLAAPYAGHNATLGVATFLGAADHWLGVLAGVAGRFNRGHRAPGGRAETAPGYGVAAVVRPYRASLRPGADHARRRRGHRTGAPAHRIRAAHGRRTRSWGDQRQAAAAGLTTPVPAGERWRAIAGRGTPRSTGTPRPRPWPRRSRRGAAYPGSSFRWKSPIGFCDRSKRQVRNEPTGWKM